ncbi:MAG: hypothetical protein NC434_06530 [Ruminococcus sp.]|nr:hypothetical protein [Ruminococcus sp.]
MVKQTGTDEFGNSMSLYTHPADCRCGSVSYGNVTLYRMNLDDLAGEANALAQKPAGIPWSVAIAAANENKSVGEYMNNAVTSTPGLSETTPVAQGGNVVIDGRVSTQTFTVKKVLPAHVSSIKEQAGIMGGKVLNCVDIDGFVYFNTATVNFYMPGVVSGQNIQVYYLSGGAWTPLNVTEIREDHVIVDMTGYGIVAFVELPAQTPVETSDEAPVETPAEVSVEAPVETPAEVSVEAPVEAPVEASVETPVEAPAEVPAE